jgi:GNAT superfamily N-acetyltransferase
MSLDSLPPVWVPATAVPPYTRLRPAQPADQTNLHQACYPELGLVEFIHRFERSLERQAEGRAIHLLAEQALPNPLYPPQILGTAHLWRYIHASELADVVVAPVWRNRGVGTALIMTLTAYALAENWPPLEIGVTWENTGALRLYERLGFVVDREMKLFRGQRALILRLRE